MSAAIRAGTVYFLVVFAIAFGLGVVRTGLIIPRIGVLAAVFAEAAVLLPLSWWVCSGLVRRFAVPPARSARAVMGLLAFALLMIAELALAVLLFGRTPAQHWASYRGIAEQVGLAAQLLFAAMPMLVQRENKFRRRLQ